MLQQKNEMITANTKSKSRNRHLRSSLNFCSSPDWASFGKMGYWQLNHYNLCSSSSWGALKSVTSGTFINCIATFKTSSKIILQTLERKVKQKKMVNDPSPGTHFALVEAQRLLQLHKKNLVTKYFFFTNWLISKTFVIKTVTSYLILIRYLSIPQFQNWKNY